MKLCCVVLLCLVALRAGAYQTVQELEDKMYEDLYVVASCKPRLAVPVFGSAAGYILGQWFHAKSVNSDLDRRYVRPLIENITLFSKTEKVIESQMFQDFKNQFSAEPEVKECSIEVRDQFFISLENYLETFRADAGN